MVPGHGGDILKSTARRQPDRWIFYGLLLLLFWLPVPFGSNRPWAVDVMTLCASLLLFAWLCLWLVNRADFTARLRLLPPFLIWVVWLAYIMLQLAPLSSGWLAVLAPQGLQIHQAVAGLHTDVGWLTISINQSATVRGLITSLGYFCIFWLTICCVGRHRSRMRLVLQVIALTAMLQALYGSIMVLSGLEHGAFFQVKEFYRGVATGTFVNRNNMAGYLELGAAAGMGLIFTELQGNRWRGWRIALGNLLDLMYSRKMRIRVFLGLMVIGLVLTRSRMGNIAFFVSLFGCGGVYLLLRERRLFVKGVLLLASFLIVDALIVNHWYGLEKVVQRVEQTQVATENRSDAYSDYPDLIEHYWRTGAGLGNFSEAYMPFQSATTHGYWDHAHNDYVEILVDTGVPGLLLLLGLAFYCVRHALWVIALRKDRLMTGVCFASLMGAVALGIHGLFSFNLQIPASAATLVCLLALGLCCSSFSRRSRRSTQQHDAPPLEPDEADLANRQ